MIKIKRKLYFHFESDKFTHEVGFCHYCNECLASEYVAIMNRLKENGLLDENSNLVCCNCYTLIQLVGTATCEQCGEPIMIVPDFFYFVVKCLCCGKEYKRLNR